MSILSHEIICAASPPNADAVEKCKVYIKRFGLTKDDVALRVSDDVAYVVTKREIELKDGKS